VDVENDVEVLSAKARKDFLICTGSYVTKVVVVVVVFVVIVSTTSCGGNSDPRRHIMTIQRKNQLALVAKIASKGILVDVLDDDGGLDVGSDNRLNDLPNRSIV
jgi:hypothetical protein